MSSDHHEYKEQKSPTDDRDPNINNIEKNVRLRGVDKSTKECKKEVTFDKPDKNVESDGELEDSSEDDEKKGVFDMPEHFLSANNTGMPLDVDQNPSKIKIEESDQELEESMDNTDKQAFFMPEHFLSQTLTNGDTNEDTDINCVVGASAETLYTLTHTHDTGRKRVKYSCNVCEKEFNDKRDCIRHVRVHTGEKPYMCYQCGQSFGRECYLSRHIKSHTGEKPFTCPLCNKAFARKATLEQHLLSHTDMSERPFPCNQCESGFTKRSHLERHLKIHAGIRDFKCSMCDKDFLEKRGLIDHMKRLHSDRVLPSCTICNREFRWEHLLRRHMKAHTHNSSIEESEEALLQSIPIFVSKDKQIQPNTINPSIETSDSHSISVNVPDVNDGSRITTNDTASQNTESVKESNLPSSKNEELSILNPQFFQSSVNGIGKTGTQINSQEMLYKDKEFNYPGVISEKPTAHLGMISKEHLTSQTNVLQPSIQGTKENTTNNELSSLHPNFFQSSVQDIVNTGTQVDIPEKTVHYAQSFNPGNYAQKYKPGHYAQRFNPDNNGQRYDPSNLTQRFNPGNFEQMYNPAAQSFDGSGRMVSKEQLAMYNSVLQSTDQSFGLLFPTWSQVPPKQ